MWQRPQWRSFSRHSRWQRPWARPCSIAPRALFNWAEKNLIEFESNQSGNIYANEIQRYKWESVRFEKLMRWPLPWPNQRSMKERICQSNAFDIFSQHSFRSFCQIQLDQQQIQIQQKIQLDQRPSVIVAIADQITRSYLSAGRVLLWDSISISLWPRARYRDKLFYNWILHRVNWRWTRSDWSRIFSLPRCTRCTAVQISTSRHIPLFSNQPNAFLYIFTAPTLWRSRTFSKSPQLSLLHAFMSKCLQCAWWLWWKWWWFNDDYCCAYIHGNAVLCTMHCL